MDWCGAWFSVAAKVGECAGKELGGFLPVGVLFWVHNGGIILGRVGNSFCLAGGLLVQSLLLLSVLEYNKEPS